ncbi:MAG: hypothetical protein Q9162_000506 [Coniocarpon cinnabarinum]
MSYFGCGIGVGCFVDIDPNPSPFRKMPPPSSRQGSQYRDPAPSHSLWTRCDRQSPCSNCVKNSNTCEYRPPAPAQRKKRKAQREALEQMVKKLREYEGYLHSQGLPIQPFDTSRIEDLLHPSQLRTESLNLSSTEERGLVATSNDDVLQSQPRLDIAGSNLLQTQVSDRVLLQETNDRAIFFSLHRNHSTSRPLLND